MSFQPAIGTKLHINGTVYRVGKHPTAPGFVYGQEGREAIVYQLLAENDEKALKVFKPGFRVPYLVSLAGNLEEYAHLPGLQVCQRIVLTPQRHRALLRSEPDLIYAVLMPWINGPTWTEIVSNKEPISPEESLNLATDFASKLTNLEQKNIAHCDLSGSNIIISPDQDPVLVDIEGIYAPGLPKPEAVASGSPGYAHPSARKGVWNPQADRFAGGVLIAEILGGCIEEIRNDSWGESYFCPEEIGQESERYTSLINILQNVWGVDVSNLFSQVWHSAALSECPTLGEWLVALPDKAPEQTNIPKSQNKDRAQEVTGRDINAILEGQPGNEMHIGTGGPSTEASLEHREENKTKIWDREDKRHESRGTSPQTPSQSRECPNCNEQIPSEYRICPFCEGQAITSKGDEENEIQEGRSWKFKAGAMAFIGLFILVLFSSLGIKGRGPFAILAQKDTSGPKKPSPVEETFTFSDKNQSQSPTPTIITTPKNEHKPTALQTINIVATQMSWADGMNLVYIPSGEFEMGSEAGHSDEKPVHTVKLDPYWIDQTEVTNSMYARYLNETGKQNWDFRDLLGWFSIAGQGLGLPIENKNGQWQAKTDYENHPIVHVTLKGAKAYCQWAGRRLPTEAEWEKAARGPAGNTYPWGEAEPSCKLTQYEACNGDTVPVNNKLEDISVYGVKGMAGNVREWVVDRYAFDYYISSPTNNPQGPPAGKHHVLRGGSWKTVDILLPVYHRTGSFGGTAIDIGFRCAMD